MQQSEQDFMDINQSVDNVGKGCFYIVIGILIITILCIVLT